MRCDAGLNKLRESAQKIAQLFAHCLIHQLAILIEDLMRAGHHQPSAKPRAGAECAQHGEPLSLRQHSAEAAGRRADERYRVIAKEGLNLSRRTR